MLQPEVTPKRSGGFCANAFASVISLTWNAACTESWLQSARQQKGKNDREFCRFDAARFSAANTLA